MKLLLITFLLALSQNQSSADRGVSREEPASPLIAKLHSAPLKTELRSRIERSLASRDYSQVEELLAREIEKNPGSPELLTLLGGVLFLHGEYLKCVIALKKAEALAPLDEGSHFTLAMAYIILERRDWAEPVLRKLAAAHPGNALYPYWIGRIHYDAALYKPAVAEFLKALQLDPELVRAYDNLGLSHEALGDYEEAVRCYREAIRLNRLPGARSPWPSLNLAVLLISQGHLTEAEELLRESLRYDPKSAKAHYNLGVVLEKHSRNREAILELTEAAQLDPGYAEPHYALARIYRRLGDTVQANEALASFLRLRKESRKK